MLGKNLIFTVVLLLLISCLVNSFLFRWGGRRRNHRRRRPPPPPPTRHHNYIGCYVDARHRAMRGYFKHGDRSMTTNKCLRMCKARRYKYAGTQNTYECFCGNSYSRYGRANENDCRFRCAGNHGQRCGGRWRLSVYRTQANPTLTSNPVLSVVPQGNSFNVYCKFGLARSRRVRYDVYWYYGGQMRRKETRTDTSTFLLTEAQLGNLKVGDTIHVEITTCWNDNCGRTTSRRIRSNTIRTDFGIPNTITLTEGGHARNIILKSLFPPSFFCGKSDCEMLISTFFASSNELKCFGTTVYQAVIAKKDKACGTVITNDNWKEQHILSIRATDDGLLDGTMRRSLKVFVRFTVRGVLVKSVTVKTVSVTIHDFGATTNAICNSVNDPHMKTFDNKYYDNYFQGDFILYRHKTLPFEVQIYYRTCNGRASCNCAVAARSGDDTFIIDICGPKMNGGRFPAQLKAYVNGEIIPGTEIRRFACGRKYHIYFPTGTYVIVKVARRYLNVWVKASMADAGNTEGLCGSFDSNKGNDFTLRNGVRRNDANAFSLSWRPTQAEYLYGGFCQQPGVTVKLPDNTEYCDCISGQEVSCNVNMQVFQCKAKKQTRVQVKRQGEDITARIVAAAQKPLGCKIGEERPKFEFPTNVKPKHPKFPTPTGITEEDAKRICLQAIEKSVSGRACKTVVKSEIDKVLLGCKKDICMTDDPKWAASMLSDLKTHCEIEETTNVKTWTKKPNGELVPNPDIQGRICLNDCSNHGTCRDGICHCETGYMNDDCSVSMKEPPTVTEIEGDAFCDKKCKSCGKVQIFGDGFVEGKELTCHVSETEGGRRQYRIAAEFENFELVTCHLKNTVSAKISISNWGGLQSKEVTYKVYDSSRQTCSAKGCSPRDDVCIINGGCYSSGSKSPNSNGEACLPFLSKNKWSDIEKGKNVLVATAMKIVSMTTKTLVTTVGEFDVSGSPKIVNDHQNEQMLRVNTKDDFISIHSPQKLGCLTDVTTCHMGLTLQFSVIFERFCDNMVIVSSGGELETFSGMAIYYKQGRLVATVDTPTQKWTVSSKFNTLRKLVQLSMSWSRSDGLEFSVNGKMVGHSKFCDAQGRMGTTKVSNVLRIGRAIDGTLACYGLMTITGLNQFPVVQKLIDMLGIEIVDGGWTPWDGDWSDCSKPCGGGTKSKTRSCTNPRPSVGAKDCVGDEIKTEECNTQACAVDGGWTPWSDDWSDCSKPCGGGTKTKTRSCTNPPPSVGGKDCVGDGIKTEECNTQACAVSVANGAWTEWAPWTKCTKTCGGGVQLRVRECNYPNICNSRRVRCGGDSAEAQLCGEAACAKALKCVTKECRSKMDDFHWCELQSKEPFKTLKVLENDGNVECSESKGNYGIEEGYLWVDVGCSGRFEICYEE